MSGARATGGRVVDRPWQIYALTALWAVKAFQEFLAGVVGGGFYVWSQAARGALAGYGLQVAIQSVLFSAALAAGSFFVMTALWLGRKAARPWGVAVALASEIPILAYLVTRPAEFGGDAALGRTVLIATAVNLGIVAMLLFDTRLVSFLGSTRLTGWWIPKR